MSEEKLSFLAKNLIIPQLENGDKIFHYTSAAGLQGILENQEFWMTKSDFLNDSTEFTIGETVIIDMLKEHVQDEKICEKIIGNFKENIESLRSLKDFENMFAHYVVSFCLDEDSLLMWASYSNYMGYSIELDCDKILQDLKNQRDSDSAEFVNFDFEGKVIYDHKEQREFVESTLGVLLSEFYHKNLDTIADMTSDDIDNFTKDLVFMCFIYNMFFKKSCFKDEKEYRIVITYDYKDLRNQEKLYFRVKDEVLISYIKCKINIADCLKGVLVGPKNNSDIAVKGMEYFLNAKGFNVPVKKSALPLRY